MTTMFDGLPCERSDCSLEEGPTTKTLMGWRPAYNRSGERTDSGDPNWTATSYYCMKCDKVFMRRSRGAEVEWRTEPPDRFVRLKPVRSSNPFG